VTRKIQWTSGVSLDEIIKELKRLGGPPGFKVVHGLELALSAAYADTQARTHIITGSLKASGDVESHFSDGRVWEGTITYGGTLHGAPKPGPPNDPVDYAIYEMARGGEHDFFGGLPAFDAMFDAAIDKHFEGL
jgi:hypothetical protein